MMPKIRLPPFGADTLTTMRSIIESLPNGQIGIDAAYSAAPILTGRMKKQKLAAVLVPLCNRHGVPSVVFTLRSNTVGLNTQSMSRSFPVIMRCHRYAQRASVLSWWSHGAGRKRQRRRSSRVSRGDVGESPLLLVEMPLRYPRVGASKAIALGD